MCTALKEGNYLVKGVIWWLLLTVVVACLQTKKKNVPSATSPKKESAESIESQQAYHIAMPQPLQEIGIIFSVSDDTEVEYKFCQRQDECPIFRSKAKTLMRMVLAAPSVYSVRLCRALSTDCQPWQLLLMHPVKE